MLETLSNRVLLKSYLSHRRTFVFSTTRCSSRGSLPASLRVSALCPLLPYSLETFSPSNVPTLELALRSYSSVWWGDLLVGSRESYRRSIGHERYSLLVLRWPCMLEWLLWKRASLESELETSSFSWVQGPRPLNALNNLLDLSFLPSSGLGQHYAEAPVNWQPGLSLSTRG